MFNSFIKKELLLSIVSCVVGVGLVGFGAWNIHIEIQKLDSPLDTVTLKEENLEEGKEQFVKEPNLERGEERPEIEPSLFQGRDFLPILFQADSTGFNAAPQIEGSDFQEYDQILGTHKKVEADHYQKVRPVVEPQRVVIPALRVDTSIIPVSPRQVDLLGETYQQWQAPNSGKLGWHESSAKLGQTGNTVINGHSSGYGDTFRDLETLENGDIIQVHSGDIRYTYVVSNTLILKERWEPVEVRIENARWISQSDDERLTLISCWPSGSNTHRVVVVAAPVEVDHLEQYIFSGDTEPF